MPLPPAEIEHVGLWIKSLGLNTPNRPEHERSLRELLDAVETGELGGLDRDIRWFSSWLTHPWDSMRVAEADALIESATEPLTVAAGLSMHPNGRIREMATKRLIDQEPAALRWLVLRAGDWLPEVSEPAFQAVERLLDPAFAPLLIDVLPLLSGGRFGSNRRGSALPWKVEAVLKEPESAGALWAAITSHNKHSRRAAARILTDTQGATVKLLREVSETGDVVAIAQVAQKIPSDDVRNVEVGEMLRKSPVSRLRAQGLWRLLKDDGEGAEELAREAALDRSTAVRDVAQRWLLRNEIEPADIYRSILTTKPRIGLSGLGDQPKPEFAEVAREHIGHELSSVRAAAMRILASSGDKSDRPFFVDRFLNGSGRERRYAVAGLRRLGVDPVIDEVWASAQADGENKKIERIVHQLLPLAGRWKRLDFGLQALASDDKQRRDLGFAAVTRVLHSWNSSTNGQSVDPVVLSERLELARPVLKDLRYRRPFLISSLEDLIGRA